MSTAALSALASAAALRPDAPAHAAVSTAAGIDPFFNFNPVCPASTACSASARKPRSV